MTGIDAGTSDRREIIEDATRSEGRSRVNIRNVPQAAWWCLTVVFVTVVAAFVVLAVTDSDATQFRAFLNIAFNALSLILGSGGLLYAGAAAKNSQDAAEQLNGQMDRRVQAAVHRALNAQRAVDVAPGGEFRRPDQKEQQP